MGMAFGDGWFVGTWGWGVPSSVRRSRDGVTWERVLTDRTFSGLEFGAGRFVAIDAVPRVATDDGATWKPASDMGFVGHIRRTAFAPHDGGVFLAAGSDYKYMDPDLVELLTRTVAALLGFGPLTDPHSLIRRVETRR